MGIGIDTGIWKLTAFFKNLLIDLTANNILRFHYYRPEFDEWAFNWQRSRGFFFNQPHCRDFGLKAQCSF